MSSGNARSNSCVTGIGHRWSILSDDSRISSTMRKWSLSDSAFGAAYRIGIDRGTASTASISTIAHVNGSTLTTERTSSCSGMTSTESRRGCVRSRSYFRELKTTTPRQAQHRARRPRRCERSQRHRCSCGSPCLAGVGAFAAEPPGSGGVSCSRSCCPAGMRVRLVF